MERPHWKLLVSWPGLFDWMPEGRKVLTERGPKKAVADACVAVAVAGADANLTAAVAAAAATADTAGKHRSVGDNAASPAGTVVADSTAGGMDIRSHKRLACDAAPGTVGDDTACTGAEFFADSTGYRQRAADAATESDRHPDRLNALSGTLGRLPLGVADAGIDYQSGHQTGGAGAAALPEQSLQLNFRRPAGGKIVIGGLADKDANCKAAAADAAAESTAVGRHSELVMMAPWVLEIDAMDASPPLEADLWDP